MAEPQANQTKVSKGQLYLEGKIDDVSEFKNEYTTRVILPAVDEFSSPDVVIIRSKVKVGMVNELVKGVFQLRGYKHYYDLKEGGRVQTANMYLSPVQEF